MQTRYTTLKKRAVISLLAASTLVVWTAGPAAASSAITGSGAGTGWEYPPVSDPVTCDPNNPFVGRINSDEIVLEHQGTYEGLNTVGSQIAAYVGPSTVEITVGSHVISPAGVGPDCDNVLGQVAISATVYGETRDSVTNAITGSVSCPSNTGTYTRVNSVVNFMFSGNCTVKGNTVLTANVPNIPTEHVITGTMNPCAIPPFFLPNPECAAAEMGPNPSTGDPGSHLVTEYTAARVTP